MSNVRRSTAAGLLILSVAGAGAPIASGGPVGAKYPTSEPVANAAVYSRPDKRLISSDGAVAAVATPQPVVRVEMTKAGFDWGDAGIGAAGGLALSMIGLGGFLGATQYRSRRAHETAALN